MPQHGSNIAPVASFWVQFCVLGGLEVSKNSDFTMEKPTFLMSAIVVLLVSKLQFMHFIEVKSLFLLTSKPPKTQNLVENQATGVIWGPCRAGCGYLRPSASVLGRRYPHLIEVCWVMMRLSCGYNRKITHHTRHLFRETSFVGLSPP